MCFDFSTTSASNTSYCNKNLERYCNKGKGKGKAAPLQAWTDPEGSRKLRFPDYAKMAQDCGKVVSLKHWPPLPPQEILLVLISVSG